MTEELVELLINGDKDKLCEAYDVLPFQADMLELNYKNINSLQSRAELIKKIIGKYYSLESVKNSMAKTYLEKALLLAKDHGKLILESKCGLSEQESDDFIREYLQSDGYVNEMLSAEVDVSNTNILMNVMIQKIIPPFLESQAKPKVMN